MAAEARARHTPGAFSPADRLSQHTGAALNPLTADRLYRTRRAMSLRRIREKEPNALFRLWESKRLHSAPWPPAASVHETPAQDGRSIAVASSAAKPNALRRGVQYREVCGGRAMEL